MATWLREPGTWFVVLGGLALWLAGFPRPHVDDLFFTGTSIELVRSGQLANPWLANWLTAFDTDKFFAFPPLLPHIQALWITCFGVSAVSFTAFTLVVETALQLCVYHLARKAGASWPVAMAAVAVVFFFSVSYGMRPDPLALLLIVLGQFGTRGTRPWQWMIGALLSAAAPLAHPLAAAFVIPLYLDQFIFRWINRDSVAPFIGFTGIGMLFAFLGFVAAIHGEVAEFLRVIASHREFIMSPSWYRGPLIFWAQLEKGRELWLVGPIYLLIIGGFVRALLDRTPVATTRTVRRLYWAWLVSTILGSCLYPGRMVHYSAYAGLTLTVISWARSSGAGLMAAAAVVAVVLPNLGALLIPALGDLTRPDVAAIKQIISRHPGKVLCIDDVAARYIFDFRLPPGSVDWALRRPAGSGIGGLLATKPLNEVWLVNEWKLEHYVMDSGVRAKRIQVGSHTFNSMDGSPYAMKVIE